ncbi:hypothetical protein [Planctomicrobium piriforme]|uniref:Uncharacterized protein n=1 Tax=Planctomicrobium piriforme TaxID=1576369 RepID=A0A1I3JGE3_9PLAN|nr:hypothetical protein [Planctomicrobium piriforme]SFI59331.1 hypothetical protein SAMN05421753_110169 [Planctomicrobium piriforme]
MSRCCCLILMILLGMVAGFSGCNRAAQVLGDEAVFNELDALYTAVTARRMDLVNACETRLKGLKESGKLSDAGFTQLEGILKYAHDSEWQQAAERLHYFIRSQRKPSPA